MMKMRDILNEINSIDKKYIKDVDVNVLNQYRTQKKSNVDYDLEDDIEANGIKEPLVLIYYVHDEKIGLYDGHHRLDIAIDSGTPKVPVYVDLAGSDAPSSAKPVKKIPNWKGKDYLNPSEVGLWS